MKLFGNIEFHLWRKPLRTSREEVLKVISETKKSIKNANCLLENAEVTLNGENKWGRMSNGCAK